MSAASDKIQSQLSLAILGDALSLDQSAKGQDIERKESVDREKQLEKKEKSETKVVLLKDIPDIEDYIPDDVDLSRGINEPLRTKTGEFYPSNFNAFHGELALNFNGTQNALIQALYCDDCNSTRVERLLKAGADPNTMVDCGFAQNVTALMIACLGISCGTGSDPAELLISYGANMGLKDSNGYTIADWAGHGNQAPGLNAYGRYSNFNLFWIQSFIASYIHLNYIERIQKQYQEAFIHCQMSASMIKLIEQYRLDAECLAEISLSLSRLSRTKQIIFFDSVQKMIKECDRKKKLDKLASLAETEIDDLISMVTKKKSSVACRAVLTDSSTGKELVASETASAPVLFYLNTRSTTGKRSSASAIPVVDESIDDLFTSSAENTSSKGLR